MGEMLTMALVLYFLSQNNSFQTMKGPLKAMELFQLNFMVLIKVSLLLHKLV